MSMKAELEVIEQKEKQELDPFKKRQIEQSRWKVNGSLKTLFKRNGSRGETK